MVHHAVAALAGLPSTNPTTRVPKKDERRETRAAYPLGGDGDVLRLCEESAALASDKRVVRWERHARGEFEAPTRLRMRRRCPMLATAAAMVLALGIC